MLIAILVVSSLALLVSLVHAIVSIRLLENQEKNTMANLTDLEATLKADTDATNAALQLILSLVSQLQAAKDDPVKIQAMVDQLSANASALAKAVTDNTPART